jgi:AraC-like DNA-binding protein/catechol 2,3-dioxygenase-like lactoylglutathione lyase family enzyme
MRPLLQDELGPMVPRIYRRNLVEHGTFAQLQRSREWLAANFDRRITLTEVAGQAGFSPFHYQRLFTRAFGETPLEFLTRLRLERAKRILRTSIDPVTQICFDLGYESLGSFSTLFRREVGIPPSEFRRVFSNARSVGAQSYAGLLPADVAAALLNAQDSRSGGIRPATMLLTARSRSATEEEIQMIQRMSHTPIFVLDQDSAKDFYVNKLGFEVKTDAKMGDDFRWLTVSPPGQPDLEITLMSIAPGQVLDADSAQKVRELVEAGKMGAGVFGTSDIHKTYEELTAKGVVFLQPPKEEFYGTEAIFKDDSGNWFSLTEQKPH